MKLKTILLTLSIIILYTPCTFSKKAKKKQDGDKHSSTLYRLTIDNETFELKGNEKRTIQLAGKKHNVVLALPSSQVFKQKGIYFQYPIHMKCTYDKKGSEKTLKMWDIEGYGAKIMIQQYIKVKGMFLPFFTLALQARVEQAGHTVKVKKSVVKYDGKTIKGFKFEVVDASNNKLVQEIYEFKTSKDSLIIVLQDGRDDFKVPSKEFITMKKLFFTTLKIKANPS